jgi:hypothetical protein
MDAGNFKKLKQGERVVIPQANVGVTNAYSGKIVAFVVTVAPDGSNGRFRPASAYRTSDTTTKWTAKPGEDDPDYAGDDDYPAYLERLRANLDSFGEIIVVEEGTVQPIEQRSEVTVRREDVERYTWEHQNPLLYPFKTQYDVLASDDPLDFLRQKAGNHWEKAKAFYAAFESAMKKGEKPPDESLSHPNGGMQALLDYRLWKVNCLVDSLRQSALQMARLQRADALHERAASNAPTISTAQKAAFLSAAQGPGGDAPGSTEPTSDIDLNTFNQGTEFLVQAFNDQFAQLHGGTEAGVFFDVNVYGKDFLPNLKSLSGKKRKPQPAGAPQPAGPPLFILPVRDHEFATREMEVRDAKAQLAAALLKMRRYLADRTLLHSNNQGEWLTAGKEWQEFKLMVQKQVPKVPETFLTQVEKQFELNQRLLVIVVERIRSKAWRDNETARLAIPPSLTTESGMLQSLIRQPIKWIKLDPNNTADVNALMATENRIYEVRLEALAKLRAAFELEKFVETEETAERVDAAYLALREALSAALYFANEAYVTSGAVTQVVGGKQGKLSGGVKSDRADGTAKANIAYGAHELIHSMFDQLSDIYKETKRHYLHDEEKPDDSVEVKQKRLGAAVLGASKYFHRMFNAIKHFYLIIGIVDAKGKADSDRISNEGDSLRDLIWQEAFQRYPKEAFGNLTKFVVLQRLGFGLEALKKLQLNWDKSDDLKKLFDKKFSLALMEADADEQVYSKGRIIVPGEVAKIAEEFSFIGLQSSRPSKDTIAAYAVKAYFSNCLKYPRLTYLTIEDVRKAMTMLAVNVLADYATFAAKPDDEIGRAMVAAQRPYPRLNPRNYFANVAS